MSYKSVRLFFSVLVAGLLTGCAGMSANECELANWEAVGYEDGVRGSSSDRFGMHRKNCAKHEVAPDFSAYRTGRDAGLQEYCQEIRGYNEGSRGAKYAGVCPSDLEPAFLDGYFEGKTLYDLEVAVRSTQREISRREARVKNIENELADMMADVLDGTATVQDSASLVTETKHLVEERVRLEHEIDDLEMQLEDEVQQLESHRLQVAGRF